MPHGTANFRVISCQNAISPGHSLTAPGEGGIFVRAISALDDPVAHHGVEQTLLTVLTHEVHEARAEGLWKRAAGKGRERLRLARVLYSPEQTLKDKIPCIVMVTATGGGAPLMQGPE